LQLFEQLLKQLIHQCSNKVPVYSDAVNVEVPSQLFTTFTTGAVGVVLGAATPEPCKLVHPLALVVVTV
jgi:hypothetical protein